MQFYIILLLIFAGTVLGGIGTSFGAMVGGFIIGILVQVSVGLSFMEGHYEAKNAVALAIIINIFNNFRTINVDDVSELKQ